MGLFEISFALIFNGAAVSCRSSDFLRQARHHYEGLLFLEDTRKLSRIEETQDQMSETEHNNSLARWLIFAIILIVVVLVGAFMLAEPEGNGSTDEREAFTAEVEAQLETWRADLADFRARAGAEGEADVDLSDEINALEARIDELETLLARSREAGADAWQDLQPELRALMSEIGSAFEQFLERLPTPEETTE